MRSGRVFVDQYVGLRITRDDGQSGLLAPFVGISQGERGRQLQVQLHKPVLPGLAGAPFLHILTAAECDAPTRGDQWASLG